MGRSKIHSYLSMYEKTNNTPNITHYQQPANPAPPTIKTKKDNRHKTYMNTHTIRKLTRALKTHTQSNMKRYTRKNQKHNIKADWAIMTVLHDAIRVITDILNNDTNMHLFRNPSSNQPTKFKDKPVHTQVK